jgi:hypothetical protein
MRSWKSASVAILAFVIGALLVAAVIGLVLQDFLVNLWWFDSLGYAFYFWQQLLYRYLVFVIAAAFFFLLFFANFWIGSKYLGTRGPAQGATDGRPPPRVYARFQKRSLALYLPLTLLLGIIVALPLFFHWEAALMFLFAPDAGIDDPVYGLDVGFYLFSLPIFILIYTEVVAALVVVLLGLIALYWLEHRTMPRQRGGLRRGARLHLNLVVLTLFVMGAIFFVGDAFLLLYTDAHQPVFFGPGFQEMRVTLPLLGTAIVLLLLLAGLTVYLLNTGRGLRMLATTGVLFLAVLGLRYTPFLNDAVQELVVDPNEFTRQKPFIENNIEATLAAYRLQDVVTREYPIREHAVAPITPRVRTGLRNTPVWSEDKLLPVYRELQDLRPYYTFPSVDVGRYTIDGDYQQVFLAAREIDLDALREPIQTWVNRWLKYTHGYGVVMTPASQDAAKPLNWLIHGIPPESADGLAIKEPAIYYGLGKYYPVIAPNASHEFDYGSDDNIRLTDYSGNGGVPVGSLFRKLVFALHFGNEKIFYTTQTTDDSRLLFRRNVRERIRTLTPYLQLDAHPYLAIADGRLYWIQDALTASDWYPYSKPYAGSVDDFVRPFNYLRESVKVVVDAYNGSVDYYVVEPDDPIIAAYSRIYPGLFKPFDEMPDALKRHIRYPKSGFDVQMDVYARYHQTNPETFYNQEDAWEFPKVEWMADVDRITSFYLMLDLIDFDHFEYSLFVPMTPLGKRNMRVLAVAGCDGDNYGKIFVHTFPKGTLVYGPAQVNAFIKQDPDITRELTLWNQQGSKARRGRMVIVPVEGVVAYIQGLFLEASTAARMPQLAKIIVSEGRRVAMASTIEEGFRALREMSLNNQSETPSQGIAPPTEPPEMTEPRTTEDDD